MSTPTPRAARAAADPATPVRDHQREVEAGERFRFGGNWRRFLAVLDEERIRAAEISLQEMLDLPDLEGRSFLDVGCGSGLFSLAARRLGAEVHSFDYDPDSVRCAEVLRGRYFPEDTSWTIEEGSVLDQDFVESLGRFEIVYAWGVLHHTGDMWRALELALVPVAEGGRLFLALYNDQGRVSRVWRSVKRLYCSGRVARWLMTGVYVPASAAILLAADLRRLRNPVRRYSEYRKRRGMSMVHDWIDWLGGYPFEVAKPEEVVAFCRERGFAPERVTTTHSSGNNQFVFRKVDG